MVPESDDDLEWNGDSDFKTDVLRSARRAVLNSGSLTRRKPVGRVRQQKMRRLVFSSDEEEGEMGEGGKKENGEGGEEPYSTNIPPRFTFSDDDI